MGRSQSEFYIYQRKGTRNLKRKCDCEFEKVKGDKYLIPLVNNQQNSAFGAGWGLEGLNGN